VGKLELKVGELESFLTLKISKGFEFLEYLLKQEGLQISLKTT
jgi:hypothetical protein